MKWFSNKLNKETDISDSDSLQKARYRLIGSIVLFITVLISLPFLVKNPSHKNTVIDIKLINDENGNDLNNDDKYENSTNKNIKSNKLKSFTKVQI